MGRVCSVCTSEYRAAIDDALVAGELSQAKIAARYGLHKDAIARHSKRHLSPALAAMRTQEAEERRASLLDRIETLITRAERLYATAAGAGQSAQALNVLKELRGLLELLGRATGELKPDGPQVTVNLQTSDEWLTLRAAIFAALATYPDARTAVAGRLLELEAGDQ